jgi:hypothetical protein
VLLDRPPEKMPPTQPIGGVKKLPLSPFRLICVTAALFLFVVCSVIAFTQNLHHDAWRSYELSGWDWWRFPVERNAWNRLTRVGTYLIHVTFLDERRGWAVGLRRDDRAHDRRWN